MNSKSFEDKDRLVDGNFDLWAKLPEWRLDFGSLTLWMSLLSLAWASTPLSVGFTSEFRPKSKEDKSRWLCRPTCYWREEKVNYFRNYDVYKSIWWENSTENIYWKICDLLQYVFWLFSTWAFLSKRCPPFSVSYNLQKITVEISWNIIYLLVCVIFD